MDNAIIIICALLLNALLGGPKSLYERLGVVALLHKPAQMLRALERKLNREHRSAKAREIRGIILVSATFFVVFVLGAILSGILLSISGFLEILLVAMLLPVRFSWDIAATIRTALERQDVEAAKNALDGTLWRHHARLDEHGTARAAVELLAVHFAEKIFAPIFWYMIAGLPGFLACVAITVMYETLAVPGGDFGKPVKKAYLLVQFIPSRLVACMWMLAALFQSKGKVKDIAKTIWGYMSTLSPQGEKKQVMLGIPPQTLQIACLATIMQVSLGGPPSIYSDKLWYGRGTAKLGVSYIKEAQYLFAVLHLYLIVGLGLLM